MRKAHDMYSSESPVRLPSTNEDASEELFETLPDPFTDDEAQVRRYRPIRPSSYNQTTRHSRKKSSRRNYTTAGREFKSLR